MRRADIGVWCVSILVVTALLAGCARGGDDGPEDAASPAGTGATGSAEPTGTAVDTDAVGGEGAPGPGQSSTPSTEQPAEPAITPDAESTRPNEARPAETPICGFAGDFLPVDEQPVNVILDTDFASDVDDVGALAVLHALADAGEVEIMAVMVSDGGDAPSHRAIDAVNTYYGRPDLPIGVVDGAAPAFASTYASELATRFPNDIEDPPGAVDLYRTILADAPDGSVTIVSVGYLTNLDGLLSSTPDETDARSGRELVDAKVRRWVAMGGYYPDSADHPFDAEFNFAEDMTATLNAVAEWPTTAAFSGFEIGDIVLTGAVLQNETPSDNPVREAYRLFNGGADHRSWDLTAVLAAVRGTAGVFEVCVGTNVIEIGGANRWIDDERGPHGYLRLTAPASAVAATLDALLIAPPAAS